MSTAKRKQVFIDGVVVNVKDGSVEYDLGGLDGEPEMSAQDYAGMSREVVPGRVKMSVIINGKEDRSWWSTSVRRSIIVDHPDQLTGEAGAAFTEMECKTSFKLGTDSTAELEFCGPRGVST